ncbi:MAG: GNAT family N-acetyltransferase [Melioribacteraceae bacterium]|nr:GNAT family N-acetyltransferase [Melioribacteraceae bacterium]MCF8430586.1 GNAT family N-acetyltransferase [Melioribacteraceae bacterium]
MMNNTQYLFETGRLGFRNLITEDAEEFYKLNSDYKVIQYTGDEEFANIKDAEDFLDSYNHYAKFGFGRWAVELKDSGEFLGWCGLKFNEEINKVDIGFRFFRKYWGRGFATEAASASLEYGFNNYKLNEIIGRAQKANLASIKVLEKIGMKFTGEFEDEEGTWVYLIIKHNEFKKLPLI